MVQRHTTTPYKLDRKLVKPNKDRHDRWRESEQDTYVYFVEDLEMGSQQSCGLAKSRAQQSQRGRHLYHPQLQPFSVLKPSA